MLSYGGAPCRCRKKRIRARRFLVIALTMLCATLLPILTGAGLMPFPAFLRADARAETLDEETPYLETVGPYAKTAAENVNLRERPSLRADLVTRIRIQSTPVEVIDTQVNDEGEFWSRVVLGGYEGYIRSDLLLTVSEEDYIDLRELHSGTPVDGLPVMYITDSEAARLAEVRIGNILTMKFHMADCYSLPEPAYQVRYPTRYDAISGGYVPCKNCTP